MNKPRTPLTKVMTRDAPLVFVEAWDDCLTRTVPELFGFPWPAPLFVYRNGAVESWRPQQQFFGTLPRKVSRWLAAADHQQRLRQSFARYFRLARSITQWKIRERNIASFLSAVAEITDAFRQGGAGLIGGYWCLAWQETLGLRFPPKILAQAQRLRARDTFMDDAVLLLSQYLQRLAQRFGCSESDLRCCTYDELVRTAANGTLSLPLRRQLAWRQKGYFYAHKNVRPIRQLSVFLRKAHMQFAVEHIPQRELRGMTAQSGTAVGRVVLLMNRASMAKVRSGDILVSPMTTPQYLPAMRKAAAFVTDEGGLMCHAAIVAREMHKPCIVGTKVATQMFRDGDLVEVDAEKGTVKKLS